MKEITIRLYEPIDFENNNESPVPYCAHSWLDVEVDGEMQANLSSARIAVSALTPIQVLGGGCEWSVNIDVEKILRSRGV